MKPSFLAMTIMVAWLALAPLAAATAQPEFPQPTADQDPAQQAVDDLLGRPGLRDGRTPQGVEAPQVALGQPGLSYRYVRTFGRTGEPYPVDTQHLNRPNGLFVDTTGSVHVVEEYGMRLLRYNSSGANTLSVGAPGQPWQDGQYLAYPKAVSLDNAGNIWAVIDNAVKQFDAAGTYLQIFPGERPWASGSSNDRFATPRGIAFDSTGRLFVSDSGNHRVQVFNLASGSPVHAATIGQTGVPGNDNSHFNRPAQIAFDGSGRLYVADAGNARVQRCTSGGATWTCATFHGTGTPGGGSNELIIPFGVGVDPVNNTVYIADTGNGRVKRCGTGGSCTVFATGLAWPADVSVDTMGQVFVTDMLRSTVRTYSSAGASLGIFAGTDNTPYVPNTSYFNEPWGIAIGADGSIFLTENRGMRLIKLDAGGTAEWTVGQAGVFGSDNGHFGSFETGLEGNVALDSAGRIYVPDTGNDRIQVFNANGSYHRTFGRTGNGNNEFNCPSGVAISPLSGDIFVVDRCNQRVQVYSSNWTYKLTLGATDQTGSDNRRFNSPRSVAVDAAGVVYVADADNYRVQKCTIAGTNYTCTAFAGVTGSFGSDFGRLYPVSVAVENTGKVFVVDLGNNRVQVFNANGAYRTTIGGAWGTATGQLVSPSGVAVDQAGNVYVADRGGQRIQKFAPYVPGWAQININGFGERTNSVALSLASFGASLYVGVENGATGAQLWRQTASGEWSAVMSNGFGDANNGGIDHLLEFNGQLYAGTWNWNATANRSDGGQVWRSGDGSAWARVVTAGFGDINNGEVFRFVVFNNQLYASTWSYSDTQGGEIWRSSTGNAGDWSRVVFNGFGDAGNFVAASLAVHDGYLYAGTFNQATGGEVWRSSDGAAWSKVNADGFGFADNWAVSALVTFDGWLYASVRDRSQVWRCQVCDGTDWQRMANGFGSPNTNKASALEVLDSWLYLVIGNYTSGMEVWRTADGQAWSQVGFGGFGDSNNRAPYWDNSVLPFDGRLLVGTWNNANGAELWRYLPQAVYLPVLSNSR